MQREIRVLYPMTGGRMGGTHVALLLLLKNLPSWIVPLIYLDHEGLFADVLRREGLPYRLMNIKNFITQKPGLFPNLCVFGQNFFPLRKFLRKNSIDLIHVSDDPLPATFAFNAYLSRIPLIWHHHNLLSQGRIQQCARSFCTHEIFVSAYLKENIPSYAHKGGDIIYNPVDFNEEWTPLHLASPLQALLQKSDTLKIGFFSNLYTQKNPYILINAAHRLKKEKRRFTYFLFGDDREISKKQLAERIGSFGLQDDFYLSDFHPQAPNIMSHLDMIVTPAHHDSFGRVLIEGMAAKVPILASFSGGHKEIIQDGITGLFFNPDDPEDLAQKIVYLSENSLLREALIETAYQDVKTKYDVKVHVQKITAVYERVLSFKRFLRTNTDTDPQSS